MSFMQLITKDWTTVGARKTLPAGSTDNTADLMDGFVVLGSAGGVLQAYGSTINVDGDLVIPANCTLEGGFRSPGQQTTVGTPRGYEGLMSTIVLAPTAKVRLSYSSAIKGFVIKRKGMALTPWQSAQQALDEVAAFSGTAIEIGDANTPVHFTYCGHLLILGFEHAIKSYRGSGQRYEYILFDCTNGITNELNADITHLNFCHGWPFLTGHMPWVTDALAQRAGTAYTAANVADGLKMLGCFQYGWATGYDINNADEVTLTACGSDNVPAGQSSHIGFHVRGTSKNTGLIACHGSAQGKAVLIDIGTAPNYATAQIVGGKYWENDVRGIELVSGSAIVSGVNFSGGLGRHIAALEGATAIRIIGNTFDALNDPVFVHTSVEEEAIGNAYLNITASHEYPTKMRAPKGQFSIVGLPTASTGLPPNHLWNDNGTLRIVPPL